MGRASSAATRFKRSHRSLVVGPVGNWSNPTTWGGSLPIDGDNLVISIPTVWDCDTPKLGHVTITSTLTIADKSLRFNAKSITISPTGRLQVGTALLPFRQKATFTLTGKRADAATGTRHVADYVSRTGVGNGAIKRLSSGTSGTPAAETITLTFSSATAFTASGSVSGSLGAGTVGTIFNNGIRLLAVAGTTPWQSGDTITLVIVASGSFNSGLQRSIRVQPGGQISLYGTPPEVCHTTINAHLTATQQTILLADTVGWSKLDKIVVGPSDFYDAAQGASQVLYLKASSSLSTVNVAGGMAAGRWGLMQYPTDAGMSLTPGTLTNSKNIPADDWAAIHKSLDQRSPVANLTRNIVIEGVNDADWQTYGFGAHVMVMGLNSVAQFEGVEFRRVGQAGVIGRYPMHWHILSYEMPDGMNLPSNGTFLGTADPTNHFIKNSSIHHSAQRAIVLHGTHGVLVDNNVAFDITAHAVFLEDGAEKNNTITNNLVMKVRAPSAPNKLLEHDNGSGFWYTNPYNALQHNRAADCEGTGIWNSFASRCFGICYDVAEVPRLTEVLLHDSNIVHSNNDKGMQTDVVVVKNSGTTSREAFGVGGALFNLTNHSVYKNKVGGYQNLITFGGYRGWTQSDNEGPDFFGAAQQVVPSRSFGDRMMCIGESLNNATSRATATRRKAFASYHELLNFTNSVVINYPYIAPSLPAPSQSEEGGGMIGLGDLYLASLSRFNLFTGLKLVASHAGARPKPPHKDGNPINNRDWTLASAIWDVNGLWTIPGNYYIFNDPFLTYNATNLIDVEPSGAGKSTPDIFYGVGWRNSTNGASSPKDAISISRLDATTNEVGNWSIGDGNDNVLFGIMRNWAAAKDGRYIMDLPSTTVNSYIILYVDNAWRATDRFLVGLKWAGGTPVGAAFITGTSNLGLPPTTPSGGDISGGVARMLTSAANLAAVEAGAGDKYWQDTSNDRVWVKYVGGLNGVWSSDDESQFKKTLNLVVKA